MWDVSKGYAIKSKLLLLSYGFQLPAEGIALLRGLWPRSRQSGHCGYSCLYFYQVRL